MIIGNGMIARTFSAYESNDTFVIFASGVSNSKETNLRSFQREEDLLSNTIKKYPEKTLVYFSTCSIHDPSEKKNPYIAHKLRCEGMIAKNMKSYHIFRLSNIVGKTNNTTLLWYLYSHILRQEQFTLWIEAERNLIAAQDLYRIVDYCLTNQLYKNSILHIAAPKNTSVMTIVNIIEAILALSSQHISVKKGASFSIDTQDVQSIASKIGIVFDDDYTKKAIERFIKATMEN